MRAERCAGCAYCRNPMCLRHHKPLTAIRGCSLSGSGQKFFRATSGAEAYRVKILDQKKREEQA